jgi:DNA replication protein DnaD
MIYDHTKSVLENASYNIPLFRKELKKALRTLLPHEIEKLIKWLHYFTESKPELKQCLIEATTH